MHTVSNMNNITFGRTSNSTAQLSRRTSEIFGWTSFGNSSFWTKFLVTRFGNEILITRKDNIISASCKIRDNMEHNVLKIFIYHINIYLFL